MITKSKLFCACALLLLFCAGAPSDDKAPNDNGEVVKEALAALSAEKAGELDAIRGTATAFAKAFNARDAKAVAALWIENADYRDETGSFFHGRDAIEQRYAEFFAEHSGREMKMELSLESVRLITPTLAVEDGVGTISPPVPGPPVAGRYTATHVFQDGKWLLACVREWKIEVETNYSHLSPLEWLIGHWVGNAADRTTHTTFEWTKNKNFIKRTFTTKKGDEDFTMTAGTQLIGFDGSKDAIRSWLFDSDGGFVESAWSLMEDGVKGHATSVLVDGSVAHSTDLLTRITDDEFTIQSVNRTIDGESVPDGDVMKVVRITAE
jgi:uncharacterized protein (TIGR02246 family)